MQQQNRNEQDQEVRFIGEFAPILLASAKADYARQPIRGGQADIRLTCACGKPDLHKNAEGVIFCLGCLSPIITADVLTEVA